MKDSSSLSADIERLLEAERKRPAPPAAAKAEVATSLAAALAETAIAPRAAAASAKPPRAPSWARVAPALGAAFLLGAGVGAWLGPHRKPVQVPAPDARQPRLVAPALVESTTPAAPAIPTAAQATAAQAISTARTPSPMPRATLSATSASSARETTPEMQENLADARLAAERALVDTARAALARGDAPAALTVLGRHEQQFPRGQLSEERSALMVQALAAAGRMPEAGARAAQFRLGYPHSLLLPVVDQAVGAR